jgi:hypothetical protein
MRLSAGLPPRNLPSLDDNRFRFLSLILLPLFDVVVSAIVAMFLKMSMAVLH